MRKSLKAHQDSKFSFLTNFSVTVNNGKQNVLSLPETDERRASQLDETGEPTFIKHHPHKNKFLGKVLVKKSSWSEHTWSTFISRAEEETEPELLGAQLLSQFQKDKFVHFFYHVLDLNMDHVISQVRKCVVIKCLKSEMPRILGGF